MRLCLKSLNLELGVCVCSPNLSVSSYNEVPHSVHPLPLPQHLHLARDHQCERQQSLVKSDLRLNGYISVMVTRGLENPAGYREDRIDWRRRSLYRAMIAIISSVFTRQNACTLPLPLKGWSLLFCFALPLEQHLRHELLKENGVCVLLSSRGSSLWLPQLQFRHCVKGVIYLIADRKLRKRQGGGRDKISPKGQPSGLYFLQVSFTWDARNLPKHRHVLRRSV